MRMIYIFMCYSGRSFMVREKGKSQRNKNDVIAFLF